MSIVDSRPYPDSTRLAELIQRLRLFKSDLKSVIERGHNSKAISRLIMASGLLDGVLEELSNAASEQRDEVDRGDLRTLRFNLRRPSVSILTCDAITTN